MKKILAFVFSAMLLTALPGMAFAAGGSDASGGGTEGGPGVEGNSNGTAYTITGVPAGVTLEVTAGDASAAASQLANAFGDVNYTATVAYDFDAFLNGQAYDLPAGAVITLSLPVPAGNNGHIAQVVVVHDNGATQAWNSVVVANDAVTIGGIQGTSTAYIGITDQVAAGGTTGTNSGATSPQTGVDFTGIALITVAAAAAACFVGITLRKKAQK